MLWDAIRPMTANRTLAVGQDVRGGLLTEATAGGNPMIA